MGRTKPFQTKGISLSRCPVDSLDDVVELLAVLFIGFDPDSCGSP